MPTEEEFVVDPEEEEGDDVADVVVDSKDADDDDDDIETTNIIHQQLPSSTNNNTITTTAALFGEEDSSSSSSEDGEFDGGEDIVGRTRQIMGSGKPAVIAADTLMDKRSMNQRLGLDSDSDDDDDNSTVPNNNANARESSGGGGGGDDGTNQSIVPTLPRRMELMKLPGIHYDNHKQKDLTTTTTTIHDDDDEPIYFITKLPNLVAINPEPYDAKMHDVTKEEEQYRGYVHNMIRWRYKTDGVSGEIVKDEDGNPIRESNTRIVKWSDGSYTLHIGTEVLEVDNLDSSIPNDHPDASLAGFPGINGYLYVSQQANIRPPSKTKILGRREGSPENHDDQDDDDDDDQVPKSAGTVLECIAPITSRLSCRPSSLASEAHRNHTLAVRQRNLKRARIAEIVTEVDPEKEKQARIKGKDDMAKIRARYSAGSGGRRSVGGVGGGGHRRGMNESYLEEEDEDGYDGVNVGRLKRQTMRKKNSDEDEMDYGDDDDSEEEDEEDWMSKKKQLRGAAAARAAVGGNNILSKDDSSEEGEVVFGDEDDDEDEDEAAFGKKRRGRGVGGVNSKAVLSDDED